jgi:small-conductance mechanosensitive channel
VFLYAGVLPAQIQVKAEPQPATGQEYSESVEQAPEKPEPEKPAGIPITEISQSAQETRISLNKISTNLEPVADILVIEEQLPAFLNSLKKKRFSWFYESLNKLTTRKLQELSQKWNIILDKLNGWEDKLAKHSKTLEEDDRQLDEMTALWQLTSESIIGKETPEAILERVQSTLDQIQDIKTRLLEEMKVTLTSRDHISVEQLKIAKLIGQIKEAEVQSRRGIFVRDGLPLWKTFQAEEELLSFGSQIRNSFAKTLHMNALYFYANTGRFSLHIIIFAALFGVMIYFYQRNKRNLLFEEKEETLKASAFFLSCPFSTALLISIFFSTWIYTNAPVAVRELLIMLLLIPVLRLVRGIFPSEICKPFYFLTGLFVLVILEEIIGDHVPLQRSLLFLITIIAVPLFAWWLRPGSTIYQIKSRLSYKAAISFSILMLVLLLASLVTNLIGIFPLGHILVSGMMTIIYFSIAIYVIKQVLEGLVVLLVRRRNAQTLHIVQTYAGKMERNAIFFIRLIVYFVWLRMVLRTCGVYHDVLDWFSEIVDDKWTLGTIEISPGAVFSFILILIIAFTLSRIIQIILATEIFSRFKLPRGVSGAISILTRYTIIGLGFFLAISAIGVDLGKFGLLAGAMGVGLGFGLRNVIENFVSGLIIIFERPIEVGDTIEVGEVFGNVGKIGMRSSTVHTFDGSEVIVPNGSLISNQVTNWTLSDRRRRMQLPVKVAFGNDPHKVLELLIKVAREHPGVLDFPEPQAFFNGFGDNYLDFTLYYWISDNILQIKSEIALGVHDTIKSAGIDTPRPKGDFNLKILDAPGKQPDKDETIL